MIRSKILVGSVLLALLLLVLVTGSKTISAQADVTNPSENILNRLKDAKLYKSQKQKLNNALNDYFKKAIHAGNMVGAGVSIVQRDSVLISRGFGKRNISENVEVNSETVFRLGSLSKGFASVLAADLKSEGKIDWNDPLVNYLPNFQLGDAKNTRKVKLSHILSHTAGTPYHSFTNLVELGLPMEKIAERFNEVKPLGEPGEMYSYQNAMFSLSQEVMRQATGKDIKTLLKDRFFKPLGMNNVTMNHLDLVEQKNVAMPYVKNRHGWRMLSLRNRYYNAVAAGGINASADDMGKWMQFLLGHNPEIMSKAELNEVFVPFISFENNRKYYQYWPGHLQSSYGFGWRIHQFQDINTQKKYTVWHHGGSVNNYRNEIALYPESDLGICVLLNNNSKIARTVIPDLREIVKKIFGANEEKTKTESVVGLKLYAK